MAAHALPGLRGPLTADTSYARQAQRHRAMQQVRSCFYAGWLRLTRPTASNQSLFTHARLKLPVLAASTSLRRSRKAGAARMDAAEGRVCRDAASARPEACRDKSKAPRSGDVAGRARGYRGGGDWPPLCAPGAVSDITQRTNRERNLPGIKIEVVALLNAARAGTFPVAPIFRRVAAAPYPAYRALSQAHTP
jgi:hypothetical protein